MTVYSRQCCATMDARGGGISATSCSGRFSNHTSSRACWPVQCIHIRNRRVAQAASQQLFSVSACPSGVTRSVQQPSKNQRLHPTFARPQKQQQEAAEEAEEEAYEDEDEDGTAFEGREDTFEGDGDEHGEDGWVDDADLDDDVLAALTADDDAAREFITGGSRWGEVALASARRLLAREDFQTLDLYLLRTQPSTRRLDIRLERLDDVYGSPSIDDIERFSRALRAELEAELGLEEAGDISIEASSPGAERLIRLPQDLPRFMGLPLKVEHYGDGGVAAAQASKRASKKRRAAAAEAQALPSQQEPDIVAATPRGGPITTTVLQLVGFDEASGDSRWQVADVRSNAPVKGRGLSRKQKELVYQFALSDIVRARIYVDF